MSEVTEVLSRIEQGDIAAAEQLLPLVYHELREVAQAKLRNERPDHTLQATALVHEAYLRLVSGRASAQSWTSRAHFFAAAAEAMRRILIESIRHKNAAKRGGNAIRIELDADDLIVNQRADELLALDSALDRLEEIDPVKAHLVKLRFFSGFSNAEAARALGISAATADRFWSYARAWLQNQMQSD